MRYCKRCLQPDTRPDIIFNEKGICYACLYEDSKKLIDWDKRKDELIEIAEKAKSERRKRNNNYDCVIGVSGGKDSTFQAVYAKEKLGLKPLLVNCVPDEITDAGVHNINNLHNISGGFDIISMRPNPLIAKKLAKKCFFDRGNIIAASEYCLWVSSYIIADKFEIPLIIQGENNALTLGTALKQDSSEDAYNIADTNTVRGFDVAKLIEGTEIKEDDMYMYKMPDVTRMKGKGIRAIWLQYYTKEWSQVYNADFAVARGLVGRMTEDLHDIGRYRRFTGIDSDLQIVNQMLKYYKFGFGMATDEACYDIREGRLTRDDAVWYVKEYDGRCGEQYIESACDYMGITKNQFCNNVDKYVNRKLFKKINGRWVPLFTVGEDYNEGKDS